MKHYVCGFLFSPCFDRVCLILKRRGPSSVISRWNGIGGKIESGETSTDAMSREFLEETGVEIVAGQWDSCVVLVGDDWCVEFFRASSPLIAYVTSAEDEVVRCFDVNDLRNIDVVPNLQWIIPLALDSSILLPARIQGTR